MPTLDFKGKQYVYSHHLSVPFRELKIDAKKSLPKEGEPTLDDNLIIHGDNLHALKALLPRYAGKVDCIFIDPPYNTGNEGWCYNDKVNSPLIKEWLKASANPVDGDDLERHDKWLCMIWPRLQLLHELLAENGVIFLSIDDHEAHRLELLMGEIFGESNRVGRFCVQLNPKGRHLDKFLAKTHEYVLMFTKNTEQANINGLKKDDRMLREYNKTDENGSYREIELRNRNRAFNKTTRPNLFYPIYINPENLNVSLLKTAIYSEEALPLDGEGNDTCWTWGKDKFELEKTKLLAKKTKSGDWRVFRKDYLSGDTRTKPKTIWADSELNMDASRKALRSILPDNKFDFPKPVALISRLLQIGANEDSIILDSFAGTGTTAHAVQSLNKEDGGNRKFILIECEEYADTVTAERMRRVINGVPTAKDESLKTGLGGSFTFCELGEALNVEKILTGENLPSYKALAQYVFYTATGESLNKDVREQPDYLVGETGLFEIYLVYKDDLAYLRSNESALNQEKLDVIAKRVSTKQKVVFATAKYMSQSELTDHNITFCQIPYAIHKIAGN